MKIEYNFKHGNNKRSFLTILIFFYSFIIVYKTISSIYTSFMRFSKFQHTLNLENLLQRVFVFYYTIQNNDIPRLEQDLIKQKQYHTFQSLGYLIPCILQCTLSLLLFFHLFLHTLSVSHLHTPPSSSYKIYLCALSEKRF